MPELPEVEAICRRIAPEISGRRIVAVRVLRPAVVQPQRPDTIGRLAAGRRVEAVRRRGKNTFIDLSGGFSIRIHLRMTGELLVARRLELTPEVRVYFELGGRRWLMFRDTRALGKLNVLSREQADRVVSQLGPEPLSRQFSVEYLIEAASNSRQPLKLFLMDQRRVAGLGNIYVAEALYRAGIHPRAPANRVSAERLKRLHGAIRDVIREAIRSARRAYRRPGESEGEYFARAVYDRQGEPCLKCGRAIRRLEQGGRSSYYCPGCQR